MRRCASTVRQLAGRANSRSDGTWFATFVLPYRGVEFACRLAEAACCLSDSAYEFSVADRVTHDALGEPSQVHIRLHGIDA